MPKDLLLFADGSGGNLLVSGNDLSLSEYLYQIVFISLFGGNIESITTNEEEPGDIRNDWWANSLFFEETPDKQFNSLTEKTLNEVVLNTSGRIDIQRAVESDLISLSNFSEIEVNVLLLSNDKVGIDINLNRPDETENNLVQFVWDSALNEVIIDRVI